jgi:hypothetical protein
MLGWFKRKKPQTLMDQMIIAIYGDPPPAKSAELTTAIELAHQELLGGLISEREVSEVATELYKGPMPHSTHDLALAVALNFFRRPEQIPRLAAVQLTARMLALQWAKDPQKRVPAAVLQSFEECLYRRYKP